MEFEIKEFMSITNNDFKSYSDLTDISLSGDMLFKEVPLSNINEKSIIYYHLENIIKDNNINKDDYDIFFKRNKEWYNKFIFYEKNKK